MSSRGESLVLRGWWPYRVGQALAGCPGRQRMHFARLAATTDE
ncbi:hypothetical protein MPS_1252 [Mycobacterium pseudoshottsii JCM 15466]|nr:hypothetical protein MPS_1252 [Mycobacterium pseudoshottsii JCM 15466]